MKYGWRLVAAALMLAGCTSPSMPGTGVRMPGASPAVGEGSLGSLIGGAITQEEAELRDIQKRPNEIAFPVRLGILFYGYQTGLTPEDQQALLTTAGKDLVASGLVASSVQIPSSMLKGGDTIESIRKLAARFQVDALLLVSGSQTFQRAANQPLGFFDSFTNRAYYEARSSVTAIAMNVYTGTFLAPFQTVGKEGPTLLDFDSADYNTSAYALRQRAETAAFNQLKTELITSLTALKATAVAPGTAVSPQPSATPSASPTVAPSPSPSAQ